MTEASLPEPVFMKNCFSVPSLSLVVIFDVDAKLDPPPALEIVVCLGSRDKSLAIAESIVMSLDFLITAASFLTLADIQSQELKQRGIAIKVSWACSMTSSTIIEVGITLPTREGPPDEPTDMFSTRNYDISVRQTPCIFFADNASENYKLCLQMVGSNPTPTRMVDRCTGRKGVCVICDRLRLHQVNPKHVHQQTI